MLASLPGRGSVLIRSGERRSRNDRGAVRFSELRSELGEISSSTLSLRLAELEEAGLIERRTFAEIPPRVEYSLTDEGEALRRGLLSLARSASRRKSKTDS
jgi:DNA-binding HxlR family transcriptional regulator